MPLHQGPRIDPRRRRHRHRRHHRLRARAARRHRLRRAARGRQQGRARASEAAVVESVKAASESTRRSPATWSRSTRPADEPAHGQRGRRGRGLVLQAQGRQPGRARDADGRAAYKAFVKALSDPDALPAAHRRRSRRHAREDRRRRRSTTLFADVPAGQAAGEPVDLPAHQGEMEVERRSARWRRRNRRRRGAVLRRRRRLQAPRAGERRSPDPALASS